MPQTSTTITTAAKIHWPKPTWLEADTTRAKPAWTEVASSRASDATWMLRGALRGSNSGLLEVRVGDRGGRDEVLLDGPLRDPSHEVGHGPGLVVRAAGAGAAEGLLADHGAGGLVVHVEVAGRVLEHLRHVGDGAAVLGEDRAGERVGRGLVAGGQGLVELLVGVDEDGQHRPEDLLLHELEVRVGGLDDGGADEPALRRVALAPRQDARLRGAAGHLDVPGDALEGVP